MWEVEYVCDFTQENFLGIPIAIEIDPAEISQNLINSPLGLLIGMMQIDFQYRRAFLLIRFFEIGFFMALGKGSQTVAPLSVPLLDSKANRFQRPLAAGHAWRRTLSRAPPGRPARRPAR